MSSVEVLCFKVIVSFKHTHLLLGGVASSCNPATGRLGMVDGLSSGSLLVTALCRSGVRTKPGVNMVGPAEARLPRLSKEGRTGPGRKRSRQKSPRSAVVG